MNETNNNNQSQAGDSPQKAVIKLFVIAMLTLFPLFLCVTFSGSFPFLSLSDGFFSIRHDKYTLFLALTGIAVIAEILLFVTQNPQDRQNSRINLRELLRLSITDMAVFAFWLVCAVSTLLSHYTETAFFGEPNGRNNGLLLMTFYLLAYLLVTRFFEESKLIPRVFAGASAIIYLLAVLNGFHIDPLQTFVYLRDHFVETFTSTIGNIDMMSSFISVSLPVFVVMSCAAGKKPERALYISASSLGFMALLCSGSDSGILGLAVFLLIYFIAYSQNLMKLRRLMLTLTIMLASSRLLLLLSAATGDYHKELSVIQTALIYSNFIYIPIVICAALTAALYLITVKKCRRALSPASPNSSDNNNLVHKKPNLKLPKAATIALGCLALAVIAAVLGAFVYFSAIDTKTDLGSLEKLLRFNERWGTHRGFFWIKSFEIFKSSDFIHKLFGMGPDTFYYAFSPYFDELTKYGDSSTTAAHNEYINYLITIGAAGLAAYLCAISGAAVRAFKYARESMFAQACIAAVICYAVQAFVNIAQPITTPIFIILASICEAMARSCEPRLITTTKYCGK